MWLHLESFAHDETEIMELHGNGGQTRVALPLISHYSAEECLPYSLSPEPENRPPQQSQQLRAPEWVRPTTLQGNGQQGVVPKTCSWLSNDKRKDVPAVRSGKVGYSHSFNYHNLCRN